MLINKISMSQTCLCNISCQKSCWILQQPVATGGICLQFGITLTLLQYTATVVWQQAAVLWSMSTNCYISLLHWQEELEAFFARISEQNRAAKAPGYSQSGYPVTLQTNYSKVSNFFRNSSCDPAAMLYKQIRHWYTATMTIPYHCHIYRELISTLRSTPTLDNRKVGYSMTRAFLHD